MTVRHVELDEANAFVQEHHRHHKKVRGHRFSVGAVKGVKLVGVAIIGRPVAHKTDQKMRVEVTRLATDGAKNACSFLYSAAARAANSLGYEAIQTFILKSESGTSLRAAGWQYCGDSVGGDWNRRGRGGRRVDQPQGPKVKYEKVFIL